jgi:hypothetical protein
MGANGLDTEISLFGYAYPSVKVAKLNFAVWNQFDNVLGYPKAELNCSTSSVFRNSIPSCLFKP